MKKFLLKKLNKIPRPGPLLFIIMDGIGLGKKDQNDAVYLAKTPNLDKLMNSSLYTQLKAHGRAVGLPSDDDMGNSEVGHNALGAGRVFSQGAKLVNESMASKKMFKGSVWQQVEQKCKQNDSTLHLMGLLSDGNVHSHIKHVIEIIEQAAQDKLKKLRVHILLDGRDVAARSALIYIEQLEKVLAKCVAKGFDYKIASGGGRMITTMDRYFADWAIVKRGWDAHVLGVGRQFSSAREAVETFYQEDPKVNDQYLPAFVVAQNKQPVGTIKDGDSVIFFNFRGDRAIEISMAFEDEHFDKFDRVRRPDVFYVGMMQYDGDLQIPKNYLVTPPAIDQTMGEYTCANNIKSFAISETQKYGHVTFFWNGNNSGYINDKLETYFEIPSDRISFDQKPEMKAREITAKTIELLKSGSYQFGRLNLANGDMVGHTGNLKAAIKAVETVDECVGELLKVVNDLGGITVITADHGNADDMSRTSHTLNPVPFAIVDSQYQGEYELVELPQKGLANITATLFNLMDYAKPANYEPSLIRFK